MTTRRPDALRDDLRAFRAMRGMFGEQMRQLQDDSDFAQGYKDKQSDKIRASYHGSLKSEAMSLWQKTNAALSEARAELAASRQKSATAWDYGRLAYLRDEYATKLAGLGSGGGPFGPGAVQAVAEMRAQASAEGDAHALRALRQAAAPLLSRLQPDTSVDGIAASDLRRLFKVDEAGEQPPEMAELAAECSDLGHLIDEVGNDILTTEAEVTGVPLAGPSVFGQRTTAWMVDVLNLGERAQDGTDQQVHDRLSHQQDHLLTKQPEEAAAEA